ncbi:MAG: hypothetical protein AAGF97_07235 [Planctomycetota bacterium]
MMSAVFLLIAGVLVGYAIAFPLRGDSDTVAGELRALREQNEDLELALTQQRDAYARLERRDRERNADWLELQASARRMEAALEKQCEPTAQAQLTSLQQTAEQARVEAAQERQRRSAAEERCAAQDQALGELRATADDYRDLQAKYNALREELVQKQERLQRADEEHAKIAATLTERETAIRSMSQGTADSATAQMEMSQKIQTLEAALLHQDQRLDTLEEQKLQALDQLEVERAQRLSVEELLECRERALADLLQDASLLEERDLEVTNLSQRLRDSEATLESRDAELAQVQQQVQQLTERQAAWNEEVESHRRAFDTVERQRNKMHEERDRIAIRLKQQEEQMARMQHRLDTLSDLETRATHDANQRWQAQHDVQQLTVRLQRTTLERDEAYTQVAAVQDCLEETERRLHQAESQQQQLRQQREELWKSLREQEERRLATSDSLAQQSQRVTSLSDQISQLSPLREQVATLRRRLLGRDQQLEALRGQAEEMEQLKVNLSALRESLDAAYRGGSLAEQELKQLVDAQEQQQRLMTQYRNERDRALAELRTLKVELSHLQLETTPAGAEDHPVLGRIYHTPPEQRDDLKQISGIAQVLEARLNELGIYTYAQIMNWQQTQIDEFSKLLSFPDRIAREGWVAQARELHQQHRRAA